MGHFAVGCKQDWRKVNVNELKSEYELCTDTVLVDKLVIQFKS